MSRGIHADVITELAKDSFQMAHLVSVSFDTPEYFTDSQADIVYGGNTYNSTGSLLSISSVSESTNLQVGSLVLNLSAANQAYVSILLSETYVDRAVIIQRVLLDSAHSIIGDPILMYSGSIQGFSIKDDIAVISAASHWADFDKVNGRTTNQQSHYAAGFTGGGFQFAAKIVKDLKWGRV